MEPVNGTSLAAFQSNRTQLEFRPPERPAGKVSPEHDDHNHVQTRHGRSDAARIFRQELIQALKIQFHSSFRLSLNSFNPFVSTESPEGVAADVLATTRAIAGQSPAEPAQTLAQVRDSVDQAVNNSQQVVNTDEGAAALNDADGLIQRGLDALQNDTPFMTASSLAIQATAQQRSTIRIRTLEGDVVRFELRQVNRLSATDIAVQNETGAGSLTDVSVSSGSRLSFRVDGDLNDAELEAITNVFAQAEQLAEEFFAGDINAALEVVAGLEFDSAQLARVSMRFRSSESVSAQQTIVSSNPTAPAPAPTPAPGGTAPAAESAAAIPATQPGASSPAASITSPAVVPTDAVPGADPIATGTEAAADPTGPLSGFASLFEFLGQIADYLQQSFGDVNIDLPDAAPDTRIRFEFSESLRLDILRAVMTETAPEPAEGEGQASGNVIQQLAEDIV